MESICVGKLVNIIFFTYVYFCFRTLMNKYATSLSIFDNRYHSTLKFNIEINLKLKFFPGEITGNCSTLVTLIFAKYLSESSFII